MLWNKLWLVCPNLTLYLLYLCCFTLHCFIFYSATVSGITWCIQPWCVYGVKHIKCWQGGREEAVLYGLCILFLHVCCFTLHCFIFYSATVSGITWCIQPWCVYGVKHIKCWQGGREEAVLYDLWWETGSGRGSNINSKINGSIFNKYIINQNMCCL